MDGPSMSSSSTRCPSATPDRVARPAVAARSRDGMSPPRQPFELEDAPGVGLRGDDADSGLPWWRREQAVLAGFDPRAGHGLAARTLRARDPRWPRPARASRAAVSPGSAFSIVCAARPRASTRTVCGPRRRAWTRKRPSAPVRATSAGSEKSALEAQHDECLRHRLRIRTQHGPLEKRGGDRRGFRAGRRRRSSGRLGTESGGSQNPGRRDQGEGADPSRHAKPSRPTRGQA